MKKLFLVLITSLFANAIWSQEIGETIKTGDLYVINKSNNQPFKNLFFPKPNFIIKRGGIANYKGLDGTIVKINRVYTSENNNLIVDLTPLGSKKFFNVYSNVEANLTKAMESKELQLPNKAKEQSLVQQK
ncbi:hypothetical protein [Maribacter aestuarii]|uniref:hypothetical protein n=1 Tax=Maribacter aestuarii TaxID=1130723 RepID=UPI00248C3223|nr:hypothetical protein [Maribacter aestuarii]